MAVAYGKADSEVAEKSVANNTFLIPIDSGDFLWADFGSISLGSIDFGSTSVPCGS
jgi:hypothetical protein